MIVLKSTREIDQMRQAGRIVARVHEELARLVAPGVTTGELDAAAEAVIVTAGGRPAFKGYHGYPASICTSINDEVVHGIPGDRRLEDGDIISIDVGVALNGYYGDAARTLPVGSVEPVKMQLAEVTAAALAQGITRAVAGNRIGDVSHAVQRYVEDHGFSIVRDYVGHGIGTSMHEEPQVPNFGRPGRGPELRVGMVLAIEPMVNAGGAAVEMMSDGWTVRTKDGSASAHVEDTVAITAGGPRVLTKP